MIWYQLAISALVAIFTWCLYRVTKNKDDNFKLKIFKILSLCFFGVYIVRLFSTDKFHLLIDFNMSEYGSNIEVVLTSILRWGLNFCVLLLCTVPFTKSNNLKNLFILGVFPLELINLMFFKRHIDCFLGFDYSMFNYRIVQFTLELILGIALCLYSILVIKWRVNYKSNVKKFWRDIAITLPFLLLMSMPLDTIQQWFGLNDIVLDFMTFTQHVWLFILLIIFVFTTKILKRRSTTTRYAALLIISLSMFFQYFGKFNYIGLLIAGESIAASTLPFHICNLATAIIPIALITKNKFLFSFTYYVNVVGAIFAIIFPNTTTSVMSYEFLVYAYEHTFAFLMPLLIVSLGIMERTRKKNLKFAIMSFSCYYVLAAVLNIWLFNYDVGVNYFYINNNFLPDKIPILKVFRDMYMIRFNVKELVFTIYPVFLIVVYVGFMASLIGVFYIYQAAYKRSDEKAKFIKETQNDYRNYLAFVESLNGKDICEQAKKEKDVMIEFINYSKKYNNNDFYSVKDFNLTVNEGEVFGFLGSNGAGKSTTIKSLVGILPFSEGKIYVDGYDVDKQPLMAKKLIGYVPDNHSVYERLTGRQYVNYIADLYEVSKDGRDEKLSDLAGKFNLLDALDKPIKTYSHGMKQKITIISALIHDPKLWVLDEPLVGLDPQSSYEVKEYMREHAKKGNTVFFSSHVIEVVEKLCDRVAIIYKGKIKGIYTMEEINKSGKSLMEIFLASQKED